VSRFSGHRLPQGFTFRCPNCGSKRTFYSAGDESWLCQDCEFKFPRPGQVGCDFCDRGALCLMMTKMGTEHHLCQRHKILYGVV